MSIKVKSQNNTWADGKECYNKTSNTYTPIEYIESTGTQYIDTEHSAPNGFVTFMDMMWTELDSDSYNACIGSHNSNEPWRDNYIRIAKAIEYQLGAWGGVVNHTGVTINEKVHIDASTVIGNSYLSVDGISRATSIGTDFRSTNDLYLFALNSSNTGNAAYNSKMRLYSCKLYDFKNYTTNLVTNGSFENGLDGWTQNGSGTAIEISTNEKYRGTSSAHLKMTDTMNATWIQKEISTTHGHKYYYSCYVKKVTQYNASIMTEWKYHMANWGGTYWIGLSTTDMGNGWQRCSGVCNTSSFDTDYTDFTLTFGVWLDSANVSGSIEAYFDDAMLIDLTETFGAGNEPTKEWCDANIEYGEVKAGIEKTLIRDYVPVLDHNNTPCLFDKVSNKFFYNKGTGNFIAGSAIDSKITSEKWIKPQSMFAKVSDSYTPVDYIETTGAENFDTGIYPDKNTCVEIDMQFTDLTVQQRLFSARDPFYFESYINGSGNFAFAYQDDSGNWINSGIAVDTNRHTVRLDGYAKTFSIDGTVLKDLSSYTATKQSTAQLYLLSETYIGGSHPRTNAKLYGCKIWDNSVLIRDFIPVLDNNGVACLYDKVHGQFHYNSDTGDFIAAETSHVEVEYIESTGTQYIDTGLIATQNTGFDSTFMTLNDFNTTTYGAIFGARTTSSSNELQLTSFSSSDAFVGTLRYGTTSSNASMVGGKINFCTLRSGTYNGNGVSVTPTTQTFTTPCNVTIFALNQNGSVAQYGKVRLYSLKFYNGTVLVRDYIPVRDKNNTACLYDKVEGKYYYNKGTGEFLAPTKTHTELEYVEVNGNQYVNTGYKPNTNTTIEICASTEDMTHDKPLFGTRVAYNNDAIVVWFNPHNKNLTYAFGDTANVNVPITTDYNIPYNVILKNGSFIINGQTHTFTGQAFNLALNLILFGLDTNGSIDSRKFYGRLYYCRIYDNGILVRDYIPVKDRNGIICLYDKVNNKYYYDENGYGFTGGKIAGCNVWKQII